MQSQLLLATATIYYRQQNVTRFGCFL